MSDWRQVSTVLAGDSAEYAVDDFKKLFNLLAAGNQTMVDIASTGRWRYRDNVLDIANPAGTFEYQIRTSAITVDRQVTFPLLTANANFVFDSFANVFSANQTLNNLVTISGKDSGGTPRTMMFVNATNDFVMGASAGYSSFYLYTGNATEALRIDNTRQVITSPTWAVNLVLNNAISLIGKDSGGTQRIITAIDASNNLLLGANAGLAQTLIYAGNAAAAFAISNTNTVTTSPTWGVMLISSLVGNSIRLASGGAMVGLDSTAATRNIIGSTAGDAVNIGASAGWVQMGFFIGGEIMRLTSGGVTISPVWTVPILLNNNLNYLMKDTGGTSRQLMKLNSANTLILGDSAGILAVSILGGAGSEALGFNSVNSATFTRLAQASTFEDIVKFQTSDANGSFYGIQNATNVDGQYTPFIMCNLAAGVAVSQRALYTRANLDTTLDSGAVSLFLFEARQAGSFIVNRGLFEIMNWTQQVFLIAANGNITQTIKAQTGVAEIMHRWQVSDDAGSFVVFQNGSALDTVFGPLWDYTLGANTTAAINACWSVYRIRPANDTGAAPIVLHDVKLTDFTNVLTRPLWDIRNNGNSVFRVAARGDITVTALGITGVAEAIAKFTVADNTGGGIYILNNTATDGQFAPAMKFEYAFAASTVPACDFVFYIPTAQDAGVIPAARFNSRKADFSAIVTRPLFEFQSNSVGIITIYPLNVDFHDLILKNTKGVISTADQGKTGTVHCAAPFISGVLYGTGLLSYQASTGTLSGDVDASGGYNRVTAASGIDAVAQINSPMKIATRGKNTLWKMYAFIDNIADIRVKFGFNGSASPAVGTTTITTGIAGAMFRFFAGTDTTFQFITADGTAAESAPVDTGVTVVAATGYKFEIFLNATDVDWAIYNASDGLIASGTVSTNIPTISASLYSVKRSENIISTAKSWYMRQETIYRDD